MLEQLFKLISDGWDVISPFTICAAYENVVILRFGKYHRTLDPGFHWKWPLAEFPIQAVTCMTTLRTPPQTLTTKDGKNVVVAAIIRYSIKDAAKYVCDVWDQQDVLLDVTMGAVGNAIRTRDWDALRDDPPAEEVYKEVRRQGHRYGFDVEAVTFTDLGRVNSLRLIQPHSANLAN